MVDRAKKISELTGTSNVAANDLLTVVISPATSPASREITAQNLVISLDTIAFISNTIASNATANVAFYSFDADDYSTAFLKISADDVTTDSVTICDLLICANDTHANVSYRGATLGSDAINFNITPTINTSSKVVTVYFARTAATSNVSLKVHAIKIEP